MQGHKILLNRDIFVLCGVSEINLSEISRIYYHYYSSSLIRSAKWVACELKSRSRLTALANLLVEKRPSAPRRNLASPASDSSWVDVSASPPASCDIPIRRPMTAMRWRNRAGQRKLSGLNGQEMEMAAEPAIQRLLVRPPISLQDKTLYISYRRSCCSENR
jgi:hypothetical protein